MSVWGRREAYSATAFVVTLFVAVSAVSHLVDPYIQPDKNVEFGSSSSDFLRAAQYQRIHWRLWGSEAVAESKRRDRPIFVVAAMPWSALGQRIDDLLTGVEVSEYLNQKYVCVRVDQLADPAWRSTPLAMAREGRGDPPDFFAGVFNGDGQVVAVLGKGELMRMNQAAFLAAMSRFLRLSADRDIDLEPAAKQEVDNLRGAIESGGIETDDYVQTAIQQIGAYDRLPPNELEFLLDSGYRDLVAKWMDVQLASTRCDITWGGFFDSWEPSTQTTRFAKSSFTNAGMLRVLSRLAAGTGDARYRGAAAWQFRFLLDRFAQADSSAGDYAHWEDAFRHPVYSFPKRRIQGFLSAADQTLAEEKLGIVFGMPIQGLPRMANPTAWEDGGESVLGLITKLRAQVADPDQVRGRMVSYEAQADAVSALLLASRLLGDETLQSQAVSAYQLLRGRMRIGLDDVLAGPANQQEAKVGLPTYLAYSAAAWEAYQTTGDPEVGWDGVQVLDRAVFLYRDGRKSVWCGDQDTFDAGWKMVFPPPVFDGAAVSPVGQLIRLCNVYSVWPGCKSHRGSLIRARDSALAQSSWVLGDLQRNLGGLALAIRRIHNGLVVGFPPSADWAGWERRHPGLPVVMMGQEGTGYRLFAQGAWSGPYSLDELEARLR